jgi:hypothetical protein
VQTYLDILAFRAGVDLGEATLQKWNEVSDRVGSTVRLRDAVWLVDGQAFCADTGR